MEPLTVSSVLLWVVLIFDLLLTLAVVRKVNKLGTGNEIGEKVNLDTLKPGDIAPGFTAVTIEGDEVSLKNNYFNKSVVFIFMSSRCGSCKEKIPEIEKVIPIARDAGIEIVYVSNDDIDATRAFFAGINGYPNILIAPRNSNPFMVDYKVPGTPYFCQVNSEGVIQTIGFFDQKWSSLVLQWVGARTQEVELVPK